MGFWKKFRNVVVGGAVAGLGLATGGLAGVALGAGGLAYAFGGKKKSNGYAAAAAVHPEQQQFNQILENQNTANTAHYESLNRQLQDINSRNQSLSQNNLQLQNIVSETKERARLDIEGATRQWEARLRANEQASLNRYVALVENIRLNTIANKTQTDTAEEENKLLEKRKRLKLKLNIGINAQNKYNNPISI